MFSRLWGDDVVPVSALGDDASSVSSTALGHDKVG